MHFQRPAWLTSYQKQVLGVLKLWRILQIKICFTWCYVQQFLSPYIDSEVNHKRHFIKIPFINKGMEFIDLHSIFKDNSVISSIQNYFNNSEQTN